MAAHRDSERVAAAALEKAARLLASSPVAMTIAPLAAVAACTCTASMRLQCCGSHW